MKGFAIIMTVMLVLFVCLTLFVPTNSVEASNMSFTFTAFLDRFSTTVNSLSDLDIIHHIADIGELTEQMDNPEAEWYEILVDGVQLVYEVVAGTIISGAKTVLQLCEALGALIGFEFVPTPR